MKKIGIFKIEFRKTKSKKGRITTKRVYYFIIECTINNNADLFKIYKQYSFFGNYYICDYDNGYYYFNTSKKRKELKPIQGLAQN